MLAECTVPMQARCLSHIPMYLFKKPRRAWHETIPVCVLYISIAGHNRQGYIYQYNTTFGPSGLASLSLQIGKLSGAVPTKLLFSTAGKH